MTGAAGSCTAATTMSFVYDRHRARFHRAAAWSFHTSETAANDPKDTQAASDTGAVEASGSAFAASKSAGTDSRRAR
jgi:hypothetical protein